MKEKMRALLLQKPDITLPEAARALNVNERNCKSVRVAYWQARALLVEELTGKTIRTLLENTDRKDLIIKDSNTDRINNEGHINNTDRIDEGPKNNIDEGHINNTDHMNEGHINHSVFEEGDHIVPNFDIYDF